MTSTYYKRLLEGVQPLPEYIDAPTTDKRLEEGVAPPNQSGSIEAKGDNATCKKAAPKGKSYKSKPRINEDDLESRFDAVLDRLGVSEAKFEKGMTPAQKRVVRKMRKHSNPKASKEAETSNSRADTARKLLNTPGGSIASRRDDSKYMADLTRSRLNKDRSKPSTRERIYLMKRKINSTLPSVNDRYKAEAKAGVQSEANRFERGMTKGQRIRSRRTNQELSFLKSKDPRYGDPVKDKISARKGSLGSVDMTNNKRKIKRNIDNMRRGFRPLTRVKFKEKLAKSKK